MTYKDIPNFTSYRVNEYGEVVRKSDQYRPHVNLNFITRLYDDGGEQKELNLLSVIRELFPEESAAIYGPTTSTTRRRRQAAPAPAPSGTVSIRERDAGSGTIRSRNLLRDVVLSLDIFKHYKAYLLRRMGYLNAEVAHLVFSGNAGAERNARILYEERPTIAADTGRMLARRIGQTDFEMLMNNVLQVAHTEN